MTLAGSICHSALSFAEPSGAELANARQLFAGAVELERTERWEAAISKLEAALAIKETPGLRFHLAHCQDRLGHLVAAMVNYDRARKLIDSGAKAKDVASLLEPARAQLERRLPYLLVVAPADVTDLELELDGAPLSSAILSRPAPLDPAGHHLSARASGYREYSVNFDVTEGEHRTLRLEMQRMSAPEATPSVAGPELQRTSSYRERRPPSFPAKTSTRTYVLVGETAFTAVALGTGIAFFFAERSATDRMNREQAALDGATGSNVSGCSSTAPAEVQSNCADLDDAYHARRRAQILKVSGFVGAGTGAAATLLTLLLWPSSGAVTPQVRTSGAETWLGVRGFF